MAEVVWVSSQLARRCQLARRSRQAAWFREVLKSSASRPIFFRIKSLQEHKMLNEPLVSN